MMESYVEPQSEPLIESLSEEYRNEYLYHNGENFERLIDKIRWLHQQLSYDRPIRTGRRNIDSWFSYDNELLKYHSNDNGEDSQTTMLKCVESFDGCLLWYNPNALFNITPTPLLDTVALTTITALYNPNAIWDITSGKFILTEQKVVKTLAENVGWDWRKSGGTSTFGGKATLNYAIKLGLNRCDYKNIKKGLINDYVVLISDSCHFSIESVCNHVGIGRDNCLRVPTDENGQIQIEQLSEIMQSSISRNKKIACVILNGGGTMNLAIDPILQVSLLLDSIVSLYELEYRPFLHIDSVITWAWLFYDERYCTSKNKGVQDKLTYTATRISEITYADSFSADFHKTGFCPYVSSFFVTQNKRELIEINGISNDAAGEGLFGDARNFDVTLENSRSATGIITAFHVLERMGKKGFTEHLTYYTTVSERFKYRIHEKYTENFEILNYSTLGFEVVIKINFNGNKISYSEICDSNEFVRNSYKILCESFFEYICYGDYSNSNDVPFIGYVAKFKFGNNPGGSPAFLIYPMSPNITNKDVESILERLLQSKINFEKALEAGEFKARRTIQEPPK